MKKSESTKLNLFKTALKLFNERGFDGTTMRAIASEAGVASGATYYHFNSKESIVFEFYRQSQEDHARAVDEYFQSESNFSKRLLFAVKSKIEIAEPYKDISRALFRVAANPESELSPFSDNSEQLRLEALEIFKQVVEGSSNKFQKDVKEVLPEYLWLYQMGIILFWIYDDSENSQNTYNLIEQSVPVLDSVNQLLTSPMSAPIRKKIIKLLKQFKPNFNQSTKE